MDEIQRNIIKRGKRNPIFRRYHAKNEKEAIATWRLDLDRILHLFNVCSVTCVLPLLTCRFQAELVISTYPTRSDIRHDVTNAHATVSSAYHDIPNTESIVPNIRSDVLNTQPIVSDVQSDVANARATAFNVHRDKLKNREDVYSQTQGVSIVHTLIITERPLTIA